MIKIVKERARRKWRKDTNGEIKKCERIKEEEDNEEI